MRNGMRTLGVCLLVAVATVIAILVPVAAEAGGRRSIPAPWGWLAVIALAAVAMLQRMLHEHLTKGS